MSLNVEVRAEAGYWSVYVGGQRMVDRESFAAADRIADELRDPTGRPSECAEVADSIRRYFGREELRRDAAQCPHTEERR